MQPQSLRAHTRRLSFQYAYLLRPTPLRRAHPLLRKLGRGHLGGGWQSSRIATGLEDSAARAYRLLGRMGGAAHAVLGANAHTISQSTEGGPMAESTQWDTQKRLMLELPLSASSLHFMWLDAVLPRAAELACTAGDRPTKARGGGKGLGLVGWLVGMNRFVDAKMVIVKTALCACYSQQ